MSGGTSKTTLQKDLSFLKRVWKDIRKRATTEKVPSLIYQEPGLASRSVRDYLSDDVSEVWVDNAETAEAIREMASLLFPRKGDLVHLYEKHDKTLWEHFGLLNQIEQVHSREVLMPSGGRWCSTRPRRLWPSTSTPARSAARRILRLWPSVRIWKRRRPSPVSFACATSAADRHRLH